MKVVLLLLGVAEIWLATRVGSGVLGLLGLIMVLVAAWLYYAEWKARRGRGL